MQHRKSLVVSLVLVAATAVVLFLFSWLIVGQQPTWLLWGAAIAGALAALGAMSETLNLVDRFVAKRVEPQEGLLKSFTNGTATEIAGVEAFEGHPDAKYFSCFISYAGENKNFSEKLYADLTTAGVQCWFAPEDMKIGDSLREELDKAIRMHTKLLIVLSKHSVKKPWVEKEALTALDIAYSEDKLVLIPIRLDNAIFEQDIGWAADIRRKFWIGDFENWEDQNKYQQSFHRLLKSLIRETTNG